jgi:hypothetical protein
MNRPMPVLLLDQINAERLVESPKLLDLACFQDQKCKRNVSHECALYARTSIIPGLALRQAPNQPPQPIVF